MTSSEGWCPKAMHAMKDHKKFGKMATSVVKRFLRTGQYDVAHHILSLLPADKDVFISLTGRQLRD